MKRMRLMILAIGLLLLAPAARAGWTATQRLTWNSGSSWASAIGAYPPSYIYVIYYDNTTGNSKIYLKKSTNGGTSWAPSKRLTWMSGDAYMAAMAINGYGYIYLVWYDGTPGNDEIYFNRSTDGGASWSTCQRLTWTSSASHRPQIVADSLGHLHVVWNEETAGGWEIYYKKSTNGGDSWLPNKRLTWTGGASSHPRIAVESSGHLHVVWHEETAGNAEIYYKKSTDNGDTWTANKRLTWNAGDSWSPAMAMLSSGDIHIAWDDDTPGNREIYYKKSADGGDTWTSSKRVTRTTNTSSDAAIAVDSSGNLHVVWDDHTPGNWEVYHSQSTDGGVTWSAGQRLTWNSGQSSFSAIAVDTLGNLHVAWSDNTPGNFEVYYKKYSK
jgi:BNR repeat-like domain